MKALNIKQQGTIITAGLVLLAGILNVTKAQELKTFQGHTSYVYSVAFSPDGDYLLSGSFDKTLKLWEISTGRLVRTFDGHKDGITSVAFSPNGLYVLSGSADDTIRLWETATGKLVHKFKDDKNVWSVAFSPDGRYILSGGEDGTMKLWGAYNGKLIYTFKHGAIVLDVSFSTDRKYVLSAGWNNTLKLWNTSNGQLVRSFNHGIGVRSTAFSSDGKYMLSGGDDNTMKLWEIPSGKLLHTYTGHKSYISSVAFSRDGKFVLSGSADDKTMKLWKTFSGELVNTYKLNAGVLGVAFAPDGKSIASGTASATDNLKLWTTDTAPKRPAISAVKLKIADIVRARIEKWQEKGKYESTDAYTQRVTEIKRQDLVQEYTTELVDSVALTRFDPVVAKTNYDADNETFEVIFTNKSSIYIKVPIKEAPLFDKNLKFLRFRDMSFFFTEDDNFVLRQAKIFNPANNKTYLFSSGQELAFNTSNLALNFDPIEVQVEADDAIQRVNKGTTKIEVGKADVDINIPKTNISNPDAIAVVIGNRRYRGDTPEVLYATNDAKTVKEYLIKVFGFKPGNILYEENATKTSLEVLLGDERTPGKLGNYVKPGISDVFFFYSGHGAPDPNTKTGYLIPTDGDPSSLAISGYSLDVLYKNLGAINARSVQVVIDACFSGATGNGGMLVQNASPIGIEIINPASKLKNGLVITASSGSQVASWFPDKGHGLLTYFYLKGLRGDADLNKDKQITSSELNQYLSDQSNGVPYYARRLHNREQTPGVFMQGKNKIIVTYN